MRDLTNTSVTKALLLVAIPTMLSSILQFSYNIIDMYFLGQYDSTGSIIASVGTASLFINFAVGIGFLSVLGTGIKTSQSLGAKNTEDFKKYISSGLFINILVAIIVCVGLYISAPSLISILGLTEKSVYDNAVLYLRLYSFAIFFSFFNSFFTRIMSSMGTSYTSLKINCIGIIANIILDPILIFKFNLGISGAVIATIISNAIVTLIYLAKFYDIFSFKKVNVEKEKCQEILKLSYPYVLQRIMFGVISILMGKIMVYSGSSSAIAGQKLGLQVESVTLMVIGGLLTATSAFTGQNYGAKKYDRIKEGFNRAIEIGVVYTLFTGFIFIFFGKNIISIFTDDAQTIYYGASYLFIVALGQVFAVLEMVGNGFYNGISRPKVPTIISITITPLRIVFALLLLPHFGVIGVFIGILITTVLKGIISYGYYLLKVKNTLT